MRHNDETNEKSEQTPPFAAAARDRSRSSPVPFELCSPRLARTCLFAVCVPVLSTIPRVYAVSNWPGGVFGCAKSTAEHSTAAATREPISEAYQPSGAGVRGWRSTPHDERVSEQQRDATLLLLALSLAHRCSSLGPRIRRCKPGSDRRFRPAQMGGAAVSAIVWSWIVLCDLRAGTPTQSHPLAASVAEQSRESSTAASGGSHQRVWHLGTHRHRTEAEQSPTQPKAAAAAIPPQLLSAPPTRSRLASPASLAMQSRASFPLLCLSLLLVLPCLTSAFYFHITEGSKKCFIEEVPEDVLVMGKYTSPDHAKLNLNAAGYIDGERYAGIKVTVTDPRQEVLLTHDTTVEGRFGFTSVVGGEHVICIATNTSSWYGQNRNFVRTTSETQATEIRELRERLDKR